MLKVDRFRVKPGSRVSLRRFDPADTAGITKPEAAQRLKRNLKELAAQQDVLYAQDRYALLVVLQAMDAAGKDGTIKHVMGGLNPQGCQVFSFKAPSDEELDHDFLWRTSRALPERGRIGIHNRSHYEEVIITRVHPELLAQQKLPPHAVDDRFWKQRFDQINAFERYLTGNGILVVKFFLHVSKAEQKRRFLRRIQEPEKHWKFEMHDVYERAFWSDYMSAYEAAFAHTSTAWAPWYVIPADNKWFTRLAVGSAITDTLRRLDLAYPTCGPERRKDLMEARRLLRAEARPVRKR